MGDDTRKQVRRTDVILDRAGLRGRSSALALMMLVVASACDGDPGSTMAPDCPIDSGEVFVHITRPDGVDLLFLIDNSNSMIEEQASLVNQFPRLVAALSTGEITDASTGVVTRTFPPVPSLQVGVVDSDMGTAGFSVPTCTDSDFGDDGILRTRGFTAIAGCSGSYPSFLEFTRAQDAAAFAADMRCVASVGTAGCGFEQHLEATLKALTPSTSSITFAEGTRGHGDVENGGFLRPDSLLAVVLVADEDDCSASDGDIFNQSSERYVGDLNLRCFQYPEALYPISRYVSGLLDLRPGSPELLLFGAIVGVPTDLTRDSGAIDYAAILADRRMQRAPDPAMPSRLTPSCNVPGRGLAFPPVRITEVAQGLDAAGAGVVLQSICQQDFSGPVDAILEKLADILGAICLPDPHAVDASGTVNCDLIEELPATGDLTTCDQLADAGRAFLRTDVDEYGVAHEVCKVQQLVPDRSGAGIVPPSGVGWYYDDFSTGPGSVVDVCGADSQRVAFTDGAEPTTGARLRLECPPLATAPVELGTPCAHPQVDCSASSTPNLFCNPGTNTCTSSCSRDRDCARRGLGGFVCVDSDGAQACGASGSSSGECFCVNPNCGFSL